MAKKKEKNSLMGRPSQYNFEDVKLNKKGVFYPQSDKDILIPIANNKVRQAAQKYAKSHGVTFVTRTERNAQNKKIGIRIIRIA